MAASVLVVIFGVKASLFEGIQFMTMLFLDSLGQYRFKHVTDKAMYMYMYVIHH